MAQTRSGGGIGLSLLLREINMEREEVAKRVLKIINSDMKTHDLIEWHKELTMTPADIEWRDDGIRMREIGQNGNTGEHYEEDIYNTCVYSCTSD